MEKWLIDHKCGCRLGGECGRSMDGCIRWEWRSSMGRGSFGGKCGLSDCKFCNQWELCGIVIFSREAWRRGSSQITLGFLVTSKTDELKPPVIRGDSLASPLSGPVGVRDLRREGTINGKKLSVICSNI